MLGPANPPIGMQWPNTQGAIGLGLPGTSKGQGHMPLMCPKLLHIRAAEWACSVDRWRAATQPSDTHTLTLGRIRQAAQVLG